MIADFRSFAEPFNDAMPEPTKPQPTVEGYRLRRIARSSDAVFGDALPPICPYIFSRDYFEKHGTDGICHVRYSKNGICHTGNNKALVGICESILDGSRDDYARMVYIHELAHIAACEGRHNDIFESVLNSMLSRYNKWTGSSLQNDYAGYLNTDSGTGKVYAAH